MRDRTEYFDMSRKIIATTTTDSWRNVPHCSIVYEAEAGRLMEHVRGFNDSHSKDERISINSAMLKVITEGIKAAPNLNAHVSYSRGLVKGKVTLMEHIDISVPVLYGDGKMMTVKMPHMENRSMRGIQSMMNEYRKRIDQTDMEVAMYLTGLTDTVEGLLHGRVLRAAGRLIGAWTGKGRVAVSAGRMLESMKKGKEGKALAPDDIRQGSITVSSLGPLYRNWKGYCAMLQVVPPQVCAIAVGALQKKPDAEDDRIVIREFIPVTIAIDHRALDFSDIVPLMERMDEILDDDELIKTLF
ncbi:MAG: 2-oxo acid dehydrogenase subunit E2 [Mogibacterium sp.]|nr:2-oxo acid dehydrogenase subunit E2 [Mogibacterium sp.]